MSSITSATQQLPLGDAAFSLVPPDGIIVPLQPLSTELRALIKSHDLVISEEGLLKANDEPRPTSKFVIFSSDFINLQLATVTALALPIALADFDTQYGSFTSRDKVVGCVQALKDLNAHCAKFGNPAKLAAEITKLATGDKPATLYGQIVWLSQRIANAAETFTFTYKELQEALKETDDEEERYDMLKSLLLGSGKRGLIKTAETIGKETVALRAALLKYNEEMAVVKAPIDTYFSKQSDIYKEAEKANKDIAEKLTQKQALLESTRSAYVDLVAAATASSVGLFIISGGMLWPLSAVAGGVLGDLAEKARKRANEIEAEIGSLSAETRKKARLVTDIGSLNQALTPLDKYLKAVCKSLEDIAGVWNDVTFRLHKIVEETSPEALKDLDTYEQRTNIRVAQEKWKKTAEKTYDFTSKAFITVQSNSQV
ncbi:hypothetical protein [Hymenobacter swuensis]|uniref:Uncharacterized protein n=1 Tax=Hymenobacter swuensis DY53 TaxID=1227739 RepID=W8EZK7_9BACT|nr:hypothetical protein [Hymenobacter swuensis]AHJ97197.1 hypothetical protein Hsw_1602 [Hymenobacter swuensis DY53]